MHLDELYYRYNLTPFQMFILNQNGYKYNLNKIRKIGKTIYAPYKCEISRSFYDSIQKILRGPRMDIIGPAEMLATDTRTRA